MDAFGGRPGTAQSAYGQFDVAFDPVLANAEHIALFQTQDNPKPQGKYVITRGFEKFAFPKIVDKISDEDLIIKRKALLAACELLNTGEARVQCVGAGIVPALTKCLTHEDATVRERTAACLELIAVNDQGCEELLACGSVGALCDLLRDVERHPEDDVRNSAYSALVEASRTDRVRLELVEDKRMLKWLVESGLKGESPQPAMALELMRCAMMCTKSEAALEQLLGCGGVAAVAPLLTGDYEVRECASLVINLLCVPFEGKTAATEAGAVPLLVDLLSDHPLSVTSAAAAALTTLTVDIPAKKAMVECGGGAPLAMLLDVEDEKLIVNVLLLVTSIAEDPEGRRQLQACLQRIRNIQLATPSALIERCAAHAVRQVMFNHLPHAHLPTS